MGAVAGVLELCYAMEMLSRRCGGIGSTCYDCHIYKPLINSWWFILGILYALHFVYLVVVVRRVSNKHHSIKSVWHNKQLRVLVIGGGFALLRVIEGIHRFTAQVAVGEGLFLTLINAISGWGFWGFMCPSILLSWMGLVISQSMMSGKKRGEELTVKMKTMRSRMHHVMWIASLPYTAVILTFFVKDIHAQIALNCFYYAAHAVLGIVVVDKGALPAAEAILEALTESAAQTDRKGSKDNRDSSEKKIGAALTKLTIFVREARKNSMLNTLLCFLFAVLPWLFTFASYQLIVGWTSGVVIVQLMLWTLAPNLLTEKNLSLKMPSLTNVI